MECRFWKELHGTMKIPEKEIALFNPMKSVLKHNEEDEIRAFAESVGSLGMQKGPLDKLIMMFRMAFSKKEIKKRRIDWDFVRSLTESQQIIYESLPDPRDPRELLDGLVVVKLNGALGTSMGLTIPKSLIKVVDDLTFFDIYVDQIRQINQTYDVNIPLVLMQSFYTEDLMRPHIEKVKDVRILTFLQSRFPKIYADSLRPLPKNSRDPFSMWNPSGHGAVYQSLRESGLLDRFIAEGKKYIMISNVDNLGATPDVKILGKIDKENFPFAMEIVPRSPNDVKGGIPVNYKGKIRLIESSQVPTNDLERFNDNRFLSYFNSNNIWASLTSIRDALETDNLNLDVLVNEKCLNGRAIVQLESPCGSAICCFPRAVAFRVPRDRFIPVKNCNELLLARSDIYIRENSFFKINPKRTTSLPSIRLNHQYHSLNDFSRHFPCRLSLTNLKNLEIKGDVTFGDHITLEGNVTFNVPPGLMWLVPSHTIFRDVIITDESQFMR